MLSVDLEFGDVDSAKKEERQKCWERRDLVKKIEETDGMHVKLNFCYGL
jgi:thiamine pyrophosphokinase